MSESYFTIWKTPWGWMGLVGTPVGVRRVYLPMEKKEGVLGLVQKTFPQSVESGDFFHREVEQIHEYFAGARKTFQIPLDLSHTTPFQRRVYEILLTVPFGEMRTYGWLARKIGNPKALRAVGNANSKNPCPLIVPCHRIIGSNGSLTGFSAPGGLDLKARLLSHEGVRLEKNQRPPLSAQGRLF